MITACEFDRAHDNQRSNRDRRSTTDVITDVLRPWHAGDDTAAIAAVLGMAQADVCRIVAADQDRRHAARRRSGLA